MRKLALLIPVAVVFAVLAMPDRADAQTRCGNDICIGSKNSRVRVLGNLEVISPDGGFSVTSTGAVTAPGVTNSGTSSAVGATTLGTVDAGSAWFRGDVQFAGQPIFLAPLKCGADVACGSVALSSGTPSTATKTVTAGSTCVCWPVGTTAAIAAGGCAANVSSTTATFTGPNTVTTTVAWMCFK